MKADAKKVARLLKTARGQIDGILKMVGEDQYCMDISHQLLACQAVLKRANDEVLQGHMEHCVREALLSGSQEEISRKTEEIIALMHKLSQ